MRVSPALVIVLVAVAASGCTPAGIVPPGCARKACPSSGSGRQAAAAIVLPQGRPSDVDHLPPVEQPVARVSPEPSPALRDEETIRQEILREEEQKSRAREVEVRTLPDGSVEVGSPAARVTLRLYVDYQCAYCREFDETIMDPLLERFVKTGEVRLQVAMLPLAIHDRAWAAAEAALCAGAQGQFLAMHRALLAPSGSLSRQHLFRLGDDLGLAADAYRQCLDGRTMSGAVLAQRETAKRRGIAEVPTIVLGEHILPGVYPWADVEFLIEQELEGG